MFKSSHEQTTGFGNVCSALQLHTQLQLLRNERKTSGNRVNKIRLHR